MKTFVKIFLFLTLLAIAFFVGHTMTNIGDLIFSRKIGAEGKLNYQDKPDPTLSLKPPTGYFIKDTVTERVYVNCSSGLSPQPGLLIYIRGYLNILCSVDNQCFANITGECVKRN